MNTTLLASLTQVLSTDLHNQTQRVSKYLDPKSIEVYVCQNSFLVFCEAENELFVSSIDFCPADMEVPPLTSAPAVQYALFEMFSADEFVLRSEYDCQTIRLNALGLPTSRFFRLFEIERLNSEWMPPQNLLQLDQEARSLVTKAITNARPVLKKEKFLELYARGWRPGRMGEIDFVYHPLAFLCVLDSSEPRLMADVDKIFLVGE